MSKQQSDTNKTKEQLARRRRLLQKICIARPKQSHLSLDQVVSECMAEFLDEEKPDERRTEQTCS